MKRLICILASAALLGACEQKTEVAPAAPAEKKTENNTTIVNPPANAPPADGAVDIKTKTETKTETTSSSPNP